MPINDCKLLELNKIYNPQGNLTVITNNLDIPFEVKRIYYLYDVPSGEERGGHAHHNLQQLVIAVSGSFDVIIDDGMYKKTINLNRPFIGLYINNYIWRELKNFSSGSVCLVLASDFYKEEDYIRNYKEFLKEVRNLKK
jgi:dTDP-4-dehydrorhamnose 3,5-epimerase-like enzyme